MKWMTRERPKIDRIACPWLIARYEQLRHGMVIYDALYAWCQRDACP
ncbi:hypothetical protein C5O80_14450 [Burkholderia sp. SRS-46]|nr:hypothetical protein C5O80_14450 [Burkholderia sp. SRS-46]